jgi:hypothetical protein
MRALVLAVQVPIIVPCTVKQLTGVFIMPDGESCRERAVRALNKFKRSENMLIRDVKKVLEGCEYKYVGDTVARHIFGALKNAPGATKIGDAIRYVDTACTPVWGLMDRLIVARAAMLYSVADIRDLAGVDTHTHVTVYFIMRGITYILRGRVNKDVLMGLELGGVIGLFAETVIPPSGHNYALQEVLIEEGIARDVAAATYMGYMPRDAWKDIYRLAVESGSKDEIRKAVSKAVREVLAAR